MTEGKGNKVEDTEKKRIGIIVGIGAFSIVAVILLTIAGIWLLSVPQEVELPTGPEVVLNEYITVEFKGYDGFGEAEIVIHEDDFLNDNQNKICLTDELIKRMKQNGLYKSGLPYDIAEWKDEDVIEYFMDTVFDEIALSGNGELSNGDSVVLSWSADLRGAEKERLDELFGVEIVAKEMTVRVEGLKAVETFDPFEGYEPAFKGMNGNADALDVLGCDDLIYYNMDPAYNLTNRDVVTVTAEYTNPSMTKNDFFRIYGKMPSVWEKKFIIEDLPDPLERIEELPLEELDKMHEKASESILSGLEEYKGSFTADIQYAGYSFGSSEKENILTLFYEIDFKQDIVDYLDRHQTYETTYYYYMQWDNLGIRPDGAIVYDIDDFEHSEGTLKIYSDADGSMWVYTILDGHKSWDNAYEEVKREEHRYSDCQFVMNKFVQ